MQPGEQPPPFPYIGIFSEMIEPSTHHDGLDSPNIRKWSELWEKRVEELACDCMHAQPSERPSLHAVLDSLLQMIYDLASELNESKEFRDELEALYGEENEDLATCVWSKVYTDKPWRLRSFPEGFIVKHCVLRSEAGHAEFEKLLRVKPWR